MKNQPIHYFNSNNCLYVGDDDVVEALTGGHQIAHFYPAVTGVANIINVTTGISTYEYTIKTVFGEGKEVTFTCDSLTKIPFALNGIPISSLTNTAFKHIANKLEQDAFNCSVSTKLVSDNGFSYYNSQPVCVLANAVFSNGLDVQSCSKQQLRCSLPVKEITVELAKISSEHMTAIPCLSIMVFHNTLLAAITPMLRSMGAVPEFCLMLIGSHGDFKSTAARTFATTLSDPSSQFADISDPTYRADSLCKTIETLNGICFIVDDIHVKGNANAKGSQNNKIDALIRVSASARPSASVIFTAESRNEILKLESLWDRTLIVRAPHYDSQAKRAEVIKQIKAVPPDLMAKIVCRFTEIMIKHHDEVCKTIKEFFNNAPPLLDNDFASRVPYHCNYLLLINHLFCEYMCGGDEKLAHSDELRNVLKANAELQIHMLERMNSNNTEDMVHTISNIVAVPGRYIHIEGESDKYNPKSYMALYKSKCICFTSNNLVKAVMTYKKQAVRLHEIIKPLHEAGILIEEGGKDRTIHIDKFGRHYAISEEALAQYVKLDEYPLI